jgi:hypothetical protein
MFILLIVILISAPGFATVEWDIRNTVKLETPPIDVAISRNGQFIYVLAEQGNLLIYSSDGSLKEKIKLEKHVDQIKAGPTEDMLLLSSKKDRTVQFLTLEFVKNINISGSPFKGSPDAPVAVVVFSEFQ